MSGHANFANKGEDIVCAGVSVVAFGSVNAIIALTGVELDIKQGESGFLKCTVPHTLEEETSKQIQLLLEGMLISLKTIERDYGSYVTIHELEV